MNSFMLCLCFSFKGGGLLIAQVLTFGKLEEVVPKAYPGLPNIGQFSS